MKASGNEILLKPGDILYREGDANDAAYVIDWGEVVLHHQVGDRRIEIETRGDGAVIGELSILTDQPRSVTVEALTNCRLFCLSADKIFARFERLDPILKACVETSIEFTAKLHGRPDSDGDTPKKRPENSPVPRDLIEALQLENDIASGLERGEFSMVYQPIVCLEDGDVSGFEALMRWTHPILGNVPPDRFIKVAEDMGSIGCITEFALSEACKTIGQMRKATPDRDLFMSVNVSGLDLGRATFPDFLNHVMDLNGVDPRSLRLEVTETSLVPSSPTAQDNLDRLRQAGIGISIDDFGTGYSNLGYLKHLPLTALKIDRSFAADAHANSVSQSIVRMLVALGRELGVDVVAEGLETSEAAQTLRDLGCLLAQGFHFFKPMPESQAFALATGQPFAQRHSA